MNKSDRIEVHNYNASSYDEQAKQYNAYINEALFGMCYEYVHSGESLLDLGVGTGLGSFHFASAGLKVDGMDGSDEMLHECRKKGFARNLKQHDLADLPLPYSDHSYDHIVSCGVFHFFDDLQPLFSEVMRILKPTGIFGFTLASLSEKEAGTTYDLMPDYVESTTIWKVPIFKHSDKYIFQLTEEKGLKILKQQMTLMESGDKDADDIPFKVIVAKKGV